jgi:hypothetical protein
VIGVYDLDLPLDERGVRLDTRSARTFLANYVTLP